MAAEFKPTALSLAIDRYQVAQVLLDHPEPGRDYHALAKEFIAAADAYAEALKDDAREHVMERLGFLPIEAVRARR